MTPGKEYEHGCIIHLPRDNPKILAKLAKEELQDREGNLAGLPQKGTGKLRIEYNDAVEEALCFGWIDSIIKKPVEESTVQHFSPRKLKVKYSQANIECLRSLMAQKKVVKEVTETLGELLSEEFIFPPDIMKAIQVNKEGWKNYQKFSDSYKRIRIAFIDGARKRPEEFQKRLRYFIDMTEKNKMFGFGGIEKYY